MNGSNSTLKWTMGGLFAVTALLIVACGAVAVAEVVRGVDPSKIDIPIVLTGPLGSAFTALLGGTLFFGHRDVINGTTGAMANVAMNTVPVGNTTGFSGSARTTNAPPGSSSGIAPASAGDLPGRVP